jgi:hypothetical protein
VTTKACGVCKVEKQLSDFSTRLSGSKGYPSSGKVYVRGRCRECKNKQSAILKSKMSPERADRTRAQTRDHYYKNIDKYRSLAFYKMYGITLDERRAIFESQNGCCASCGDKLQAKGRSGRIKKEVVIGDLDHDHKTSRIRGILCGSCNRALGLLRDEPQRIEKLLRYSIEHYEPASA